MNNPVKLIFGSMLGAGIGVAVAKVLERQQQTDHVTTATVLNDAVASPARGGEPLSERIARARAAGSDARAQKEAELRALFRGKVQRPEALTQLPSDN